MVTEGTNQPSFSLLEKDKVEGPKGEAREVSTALALGSARYPHLVECGSLRLSRASRGRRAGTEQEPGLGGVGGLSLEKALPAHVSGGEGTGSRRGMGTRSPETRPDLPSPPPTECLLFFLSIGRGSHTFWGAASGSLPFAESLCTIIYGFLRLKRANKTQC